ncbi:MAG: alpha/beta fold hydrolase [Christensenellales bacterium]|jgi:pimeloyl-ACP methyl ester carboxylesterase
MVFEQGGARMYYELHGESGAPLVLLHGWGGSIASMAALARDFRAKRRVLVLDFPGHGKSEEPPAPWSVTEYMELTAALMTELGFAGADIIAHSFGARVAILMASAHPQLVGRLLLTGAAGIPSGNVGRRRVRTRVYKTLRMLIDNAVTRALFGGRVDAWRERLIQRFGSADYRALTPSMRQTFNRVIAQDLTAQLSSIRASTLLVWGTADADTPIWMGELMEREIRDAALVRFDGAGHYAYVEEYARFLTIARAFLK